MDAAFVLRSGAAGPAFVPLGPARAIDSLVARWRVAARAPDGQTTGEADYRRVAGTLREHVWDPIALQVAGAPLTCVVPDGSLALINFDALPVGASAYLIERSSAFRYLTMEHDLVADSPAPRSPAELLVAVGGVNYDADPGAPRGAAAAPAAASDSRSRWRGTGMDCPVLDSLRFEALPQSRAEIEEVCALWSRSGKTRRVRTLSGDAATEDAFRTSAPTGTVLHLVTHGFFIDGACDAERDRPAPTGTIDREPVGLDLPLVRSGLALAGANARRRSAIDADDGILTAAEVAALDLGAVESVVLSGCETGLGTPSDLEGLLGLRHAFAVAGAKTLVMSLWGVEDAPARRWVRHYYEAVSRGRASYAAVREAARALLAAQRAAGLGGHPVAWGAFTSYGSR